MDVISLVKKSRYNRIVEAIENDKTLLNVKDKNGNNLLMIALTWKADERIIKFLLPHFNLSDKDEDGWNCIHRAAAFGGLKFLESRITEVDVDTPIGQVKITFTNKEGRKFTIPYELPDGVDIVSTSELDYITEINGIKLANPIRINGSFIANTPLILATMVGDVDGVKLLLEKGANSSYKNILGKTAIDYAGNFEIKQLLKNIIYPEPENLKEEIELIDPITFEEIETGQEYAFSLGKSNKAYVLGKRATIQNFFATRYKGTSEQYFFDVVMNKLMPVDRIQYCKREK